jgi:hypothetical protein
MIILSAYLILAALFALKVTGKIKDNKDLSNKYWKLGGDIKGMPTYAVEDGLYRLGIKFVYYVWIVIGIFTTLWPMFALSLFTQDFIAKKSKRISVWLIQLIVYAGFFIAVNNGWIEVPEQFLVTWY